MALVLPVVDRICVAVAEDPVVEEPVAAGPVVAVDVCRLCGQVEHEVTAPPVWGACEDFVFLCGSCWTSVRVISDDTNKEVATVVQELLLMSQMKADGAGPEVMHALMRTLYTPE